MRRERFLHDLHVQGEGGYGKSLPRNDREENMGIINDPERLSCQVEVKGMSQLKLLSISLQISTDCSGLG